MVVPTDTDVAFSRTASEFAEGPPAPRYIEVSGGAGASSVVGD